MQIISNTDLWDEPNRSKRSNLYDEVQQLESGETFRLVNGDDFPATDTPNKYRQRLISAMKYRGVSVETRIIDGDIYARIVSRA
jgi:hypothetical protein